MRIGIDRQTFTIQRYGGISRYFTDLYLGLLKIPEVNTQLMFSSHQNAYLEENHIGKIMHPLMAKIYMRAMLKGNFRIPIDEKIDIHHATYYLGRPTRKNNNTKLVSTLYDMVPEILPDLFRYNPHANKMEWFESSDLIVSISETSASDLAYMRPDLEDRIVRIHLYSAFTTQSPQIKPKAFEINIEPYFLFVGNRGCYKNTEMMMRAYSNSNTRKSGYKLVLAGGSPLHEKELFQIEQLGLTNYVKQIKVNDAELWYLYRNAEAVLVPSMAEGFSLPLVEGLIADVPIICSDIPVHREIGKRFSTLINPLQHEDWTEILNKIDSSQKPSQLLGESKYKERCTYFSKERMVREHYEAYSKLLN